MNNTDILLKYLHKGLISYIIISFLFVKYLLFLNFSKGYTTAFLYLNHQRNDLADLLFPLLTHLGDSLILCALLIVANRKALAQNLTIILSVSFSGIFVQFIKHSLFYDWHRPLTLLNDNHTVYHIPGVTEHFNSFPSGHTTTIYAALIVIATQTKNIYVGILLGLLSAVIGYTRIYLGSHFPADVAAGAIIGMITGYIFSYTLMPKIAKKLSQYSNDKINKSENYLFAIAIVGFLTGLWMRLF